MGLRKNNDVDLKLNARENVLALWTDWIIEASLPREGVDASSCLLEANFHWQELG